MSFLHPGRSKPKPGAPVNQNIVEAVRIREIQDEVRTLTMLSSLGGDEKAIIAIRDLGDVIGTLERHEYDFGLISQIVKDYRKKYGTGYLTNAQATAIIAGILSEIERIVKAYG